MSASVFGFHLSSMASGFGVGVNPVGAAGGPGGSSRKISIVGGEELGPGT